MKDDEGNWFSSSPTSEFLPRCCVAKQFCKNGGLEAPQLDVRQKDHDTCPTYNHLQDANARLGLYCQTYFCLSCHLSRIWMIWCCENNMWWWLVKLHSSSQRILRKPGQPTGLEHLRAGRFPPAAAFHSPCLRDSRRWGSWQTEEAPPLVFFGQGWYQLGLDKRPLGRSTGSYSWQRACGALWCRRRADVANGAHNT